MAVITTLPVGMIPIQVGPDSDRVALGRSYGDRLAEILGIPHCRDIDLSFPMDGAVQAKVTFLLNKIQAEAVVQLIEGTKWANRITE